MIVAYMKEGDPSLPRRFSEQPPNERPELRPPIAAGAYDPLRSDAGTPAAPEGPPTSLEQPGPGNTESWALPGYSLSAAINPHRSHAHPSSEAQRDSWREDFYAGAAVPGVESQEDLTAQLEEATRNAGWSSLAEFFTAIALKRLYAGFDRLTEDVPEGPVRGLLTSPLERRELRGERPVFSSQERERQVDQYHKFIQDLVRDWRRRGIF
jgi:hypothetical protein